MKNRHVYCFAKDVEDWFGYDKSNVFVI